ncbi:MAG: cytochrome c biogenesis protein ResB [Prevotella sp.]
MTALWMIFYLAIAIVLQWTFGSIDVQMFSFPVASAVGIALVASLYVVENELGEHEWVKSLRSSGTACWTIGLIALGCIIGGLLSPNASFQTSVPFVALLMALMVNLTLVILHRIRKAGISHNWSFFAIHCGIWLALFSGLVGAGDNEELNAIVGKNNETTTAYNRNFRTSSLPYSLKLKEFTTTTNAADGTPTQYSAMVLIDNKPVEIAVNSPYSISLTEDIYLMNFKSTEDNGNVDVCVLMIARQPWKYPMLAGISLLLIGTAVWCINRNKKTYRQ